MPDILAATIFHESPGDASRTDAADGVCVGDGVAGSAASIAAYGRDVEVTMPENYDDCPTLGMIMAFGHITGIADPVSYHNKFFN